MKVRIKLNSQKFVFDFSKPLDISIPLRKGIKSINAYFAPLPDYTPVQSENFIGAVLFGGPVNFKNITFNPHSHCTHTECVGHISREDYSISECLKTFFFAAQLISIKPEKTNNGDLSITLKQLKEKIKKTNNADALIIRTLPNKIKKLSVNYSGTNPAYMQHQACTYLNEIGIKHLLIDLPSVDREEDKGKLLAHRAFWQYPHKTRKNCTITELIYVSNDIKDGQYLLNLQVANFENDASPSRPLLYELKKDSIY